MGNEFYSTFTPQEAKEFEQAVRQGPDAMTAFLQGLHPQTPEQQPRDSRGQFVAAGAPDAAAVAAKAAADAAAAETKTPRTITKVETINGHKFTFTADGADAAAAQQALDLQIRAAKAVAQQLATDPAAAHRNEVAESLRLSNLESDLRAGLISTEQYLAASGVLDRAVDQRLTEAGFSVEQAAGEQFSKRWENAGLEFQALCPDWVGGERNFEVLANMVTSIGATENPSAETLKQAWETMKSKKMVFEGDHTAQELEEKAIASGASPQEIIQAWKDAQPAPGGSSDEANSEFIRLHQGGRRQSSTILGR